MVWDEGSAGAAARAMLAQDALPVAMRKSPQVAIKKSPLVAN